MRPNPFAFAAVAVGALSLCSRAALGAVPSCNDFEGRTYSDTTGSLPYRLYVPPGYDAAQKYPLVLNLHGAGERGTDNCAQFANGGFLTFVSDTAEAKYHAFMLAPQCPSDQQWVDTPWSNGSYVLDNVPIS